MPASTGHTWAEGLIRQLPATHDGRNSWLLNHGESEEAEALRTKWNREAEQRGSPMRASFKPLTEGASAQEHVFVVGPDNDTCGTCGRNIRNAVHTRLPNT